jgi:hypothetical protein
MEKNQTPQAAGVQNVLTVSNSDIVTMMVVKNREYIENKIKELREEKDKISSKIQDKFVEDLTKHAQKHADYTEINMYISMMSALNPKIKFGYVTNITTESLPYNFYQTYLHVTSKRTSNYKQIINSFEVVITLNGLVCDEENEDKYDELVNSLKFAQFMDPSFLTDRETYYVQLKKDFIFTLKEDERLLEINNEFEKCRGYLSNENKMKEHLIAKMTEKTLSMMPELQYIQQDILLLK